MRTPMDRERMVACILAALAPVIRDGRRALLETATEQDDLVADFNMTSGELLAFGAQLRSYTGFTLLTCELLDLVIAGPTIGRIADFCLAQMADRGH
jgi:AcrR family transcriptional regulator